jgi:PAS domain S-box-containing protein
LWTIVVAIVFLVLGLVFLMLNIAGRREVERQLRDQLSFQEILMDTIPQLVCWKDRKQMYLGANRAFIRFFGLKGPITETRPMDEDDMPDMSFVRLAEAWDREVMETESPIYRTRTRTMNDQGEQAILEVNKVPLRDRSGRVFGTLTTADDVTREANLERQLLQSQKMEAIGTLAGGIAHDFNNILTSIINSTEMASWDVDPESTAGQDLSRALKAANRGSRLVKQILNFSRPSKEGIQPTDLAEVVRESLSLLKSSLPRNIEVVENIEPGLPKCPADPTQINQIIMNLCTNAFQAMQDRGGRLEVGLSKVYVEGAKATDLDLEPGSYAALTVTDDGPGISPLIVDKIFDPFFTTKGKTEGTGLGLAVVMGIIKAHYGGVSVESRPGSMTRFTIYLPIKPMREKHAEANRRAEGNAGGRLLFVEDDQDQLETVPRILERLGYKVTVCGDAMCAVGAVLSDPKAFDLVITDFDMPVTDGLELARILLGNAPDLPLIMVTGLERAMTLKSVPNIKKTVLKPYNGQELSEAIIEVLSQTAGSGQKERS